MDHYTMNSLWKFWNKNYGNEEVKSAIEPCVDNEGGSDDENEAAEILRIETNLTLKNTRMIGFMNGMTRYRGHTIKEEGNDDQGKNKIIGEQDDQLVRGDEKCERSKLFEDPRTKPPTCKTEGFEVVKYTFGPIECYVAVKKQGEYDWTRTKENACHAYQDILYKMDDGWHGYGVSAPYHTAYRMPGRFNMAYSGLPDMAYRLPVAV
ncbi:hypothetical protein Tco_0331758 [Tanacetum coccineum]